MKTTLDLPDDLVQRMKIRAVQERKPLKELAAELLAQGLDLPSPTACPQPILPESVELNESGFPVFRGGSKAARPPMTPEEIVRLEQQIFDEEDMHRAGLAP